MPSTEAWSRAAILPGACARGKASGFVRLYVCQHKIARSGNLGVIARCKYNYRVGKVGKKYLFLALQTLEKGHERYKARVSVGHAFRPHPVMPCKGRQGQKLMCGYRSWIMDATVLQCASYIQRSECAWGMCSRELQLFQCCHFRSLSAKMITKACSCLILKSLQQPLITRALLEHMHD